MVGALPHFSVNYIGEYLPLFAKIRNLAGAGSRASGQLGIYRLNPIRYIQIDKANNETEDMNSRAVYSLEAG